MEKPESDFWWMVKGICIITVIAIHSFLNREISWGMVVARQFINFPVVLFIFMSGYFANTAKVKADWKSWIGGRLIRIIPSYLICSALYLLFAWKIKGVSINWKGAAASMVLGTSNLHMYYCIVMLQLIILTPVVTALCHKAWLKYVCLFITAAGVVLKYISEWKQGAMPILGTLCAVWLIFYVWGIYARKRNRETERMKDAWKKDILWLLAAAAFMCTESFLMFRSDIFHTFATSQVRIGNFVFTACLIRLLLNVSTISIRPVRWLCSVGKVSFGIYLIHMFILDMLLYIYPQINYFMVLCMTLIMSYILCIAGRQVKKLLTCKIKLYRGNNEG